MGKMEMRHIYQRTHRLRAGSLSRFTQIIEEVALELVRDGVPASQVHSIEMRTRLAQRLLGLAHSWWTDTQIEQLLLRALRNEASASRNQHRRREAHCYRLLSAEKAHFRQQIFGEQILFRRHDMASEKIDPSQECRSPAHRNDRR